jgi:thiol-disulfide isomerase/thioredoxin
MATIVLPCARCGQPNRAPVRWLLASPLCGTCQQPFGVPAAPVVLTDADADGFLAEAPLPVVLDLWGPGCGFCQMLVPLLGQLAAERAARLLVATVNVAENPRTAQRFLVGPVPLLLGFRSGQPVARQEGYVPYPNLAAWADAILR